jgi:hypothetical protein
VAAAGAESYSTCQSAQFGSVPVKYSKGAALCVKTNEGRHAYLRIVDINRFNGSIDVDVTVWESPTVDTSACRSGNCTITVPEHTRIPLGEAGFEDIIVDRLVAPNGFWIERPSGGLPDFVERGYPAEYTNRASVKLTIQAISVSDDSATLQLSTG